MLYHTVGLYHIHLVRSRLDTSSDYARITLQFPGTQRREPWGILKAFLLLGSLHEVNMSASNTRGGLARLLDALKAFQNRVAVALSIALLFILYFTVVAVIAIVARLLGKDLLHPVRSEPGTYWLKREPVENTLQAFSRQF